MTAATDTTVITDQKIVPVEDAVALLLGLKPTISQSMMLVHQTLLERRRLYVGMGNNQPLFNFLQVLAARTHTIVTLLSKNDYVTEKPGELAYLFGYNLLDKPALEAVVIMINFMAELRKDKLTVLNRRQLASFAVEIESFQSSPETPEQLTEEQLAEVFILLNASAMEETRIAELMGESAYADFATSGSIIDHEAKKYELLEDQKKAD